MLKRLCGGLKRCWLSARSSTGGRYSETSRPSSTSCRRCWHCSSWRGAVPAACARTLLSPRWWSHVSSLSPLSQLLEAALFAANRPVTVDELKELDPDAGGADVRTGLDQLREHYDFDGNAVEIVELAGGYQILTRPAFAAAVEPAQAMQRQPRLS